MLLHPDTQRFADTLRELEAFLRAHDEAHWASQVALCALSIERSDYYGVERFLGLFGGMGALDDLVLHRDGRWLTDANDELQSLSARARGIAASFRRERR